MAFLLSLSLDFFSFAYGLRSVFWSLFILVVDTIDITIIISSSNSSSSSSSSSSSEANWATGRRPTNPWARPPGAVAMEEGASDDVSDFADSRLSRSCGPAAFSTRTGSSLAGRQRPVMAADTSRRRRRRRRWRSITAGHFDCSATELSILAAGCRQSSTTPFFFSTIGNSCRVFSADPLTPRLMGR